MFPLRRIPSSDCFLLLLRATATVKTGSCSLSVRRPTVGLLRPLASRHPVRAICSRVRRKCTFSTTRDAVWLSPCAASKHLHVKFAIRAVADADSAMLFIRKDPECAVDQSTDGSRYPPKEAPGRPSAQTFKGNQHPNQGNIPNGAHTRIVRTQKTQIHGNPRNIHPPRTAWTPRTRRATGTPPRTEGTRAVRNSTKKRERSPARAMRKKPPLPPFVRLTSARRGYASPRREWRCRPT